jgi:hypothetical protein
MHEPSWPCICRTFEGALEASDPASPPHPAGGTRRPVWYARVPLGTVLPENEMGMPLSTGWPLGPPACHPARGAAVSGSSQAVG